MSQIYKDDSKVKALAKHLGCDIEEISEGYDSNNYDYGNQEYLVVTDRQADKLWEEDLDNYIEECIYPELNERYRLYFDEDAWKSDAKMDGRGHSLGRYDGTEYEEEIDGVYYYIYRQN